jgi:hypothetical protein
MTEIVGHAVGWVDMLATFHAFVASMRKEVGGKTRR